jgi:hypothetical protein
VKTGGSAQVTITKKAILVDGRVVAAVKKGEVGSEVKQGGQSGYVIKPLLDYLQMTATRFKAIEKKSKDMGGPYRFKGDVIILADHTTPYRLLSEVLYTAGQAEWNKYRLLVLRSDGG